jgi:hypothetical protein
VGEAWITEFYPEAVRTKKRRSEEAKKKKELNEVLTKDGRDGKE